MIMNPDILEWQICAARFEANAAGLEFALLFSFILSIECIQMVSMFYQEMRKEMLGMMSAQKAWLYGTDKQQIIAGLPANQSELPERSMSDSMIEGVIPLSTSEKERLQ